MNKVLPFRCGILVASEFSICGKPNKERATREIPFTLGDADGEGNGILQFLDGAVCSL